MGRLGTCSLCGEEIFEADLRDLREQVVGYRPKRRTKGGQNRNVELARETGALAHGPCVEKAKVKARRGVPIHQGGLF